MSLEVLKPGFLTLLQDFGRYEYGRFGITQGGPLDEHAFLWANRILNNHYNAAQLEISFGGFSARFHKTTTIALCGADLSATLNGTPISVWSTYSVVAGDEIKFTAPKSGLRCYLSIEGGFEVEKVLNSSSTVPREGVGGLQKDGSPIAKGDKLPYSTNDIEPNNVLHSVTTGVVKKGVPQAFIPNYPKAIELRFVKNPFLTSIEQLNKFVQQSYRVSQKIDRMGYCLSGVPLHLGGGIISQGISLGTIQVPSDGQPIVLMKDRQTMGGYPQMGCVAYLDIPLLVQSMPGTEVNFVVAELNELEEELIKYKQFFNLPV